MTDEQKQRLEAHAAEWLKIASSCQPADRERAEAAVTALYAMSDRPAPAFEWVASPAEAIDVSIKMGLHRRGSAQDVRERCGWGASYDVDMSALNLAFQDKVFDSTLLPRDRLGINYWYRRTSFATYAGDTAKALFITPRDANGVAVLPENNAKRLEQQIEACKSLHHWWPYASVCLMCERPKSIALSGGMLHSAVGPALVYRDGFEVYAWQGEVCNAPVVLKAG